MDRRVVQAFRQFSETQRFVRGLITWMGFRQASVEYERPPRHAGSGKYGAWKLLKLGLDALVGFSTLPLRLVSVFGILCVAAAIAGAASNLLSPSARTAGSEHGVGLSCLALLCGTQLLAIGILGEYIGRVHRDVLRRPLYLVDRQHGWESPSSNSTTAVSSCRTQNARGARIDERELGSRRRVAGHATQLGRRQATGEVR
jgi:dolichol-phosphate mannosyltransferase